MTLWYTPEELVERLRTPLRQIRGLCASRQIDWRPANPDAVNTRYLISEEAVLAYEKAVPRQALVKPLRRRQDDGRY